MAVTHAADADGWHSADVKADNEAGMSVTDTAAREKIVGPLHLTLLVSRGLRHISTGDIKEQICKLSVNKADPSLVASGQSWIGAAADGGDPTFSVYYTKLAPGKPVHVGKDGANAAMAAGGFGVVKFQQDSDAGIMVYQSYAK